MMPTLKHMSLGLAGLLLGTVFLWLALKNINLNDVSIVVAHINRGWVAAGALIYLSSIAVRCLRWGMLLNVIGTAKWRHLIEALTAGYAANYLLPARIGELFRADYASRLFPVDRLTLLGTIFAERICDGLILVTALWAGITLTSLSSTAFHGTQPWVITVGISSTFLFGAALTFVLWSRRIPLHRFAIPAALTLRWHRLVDGVSSLSRGKTGAVILASITVWVLEGMALACIVRASGITLTTPQLFGLMGLASLSTLLPTAPAYLGTYQFVFGKIFVSYAYPEIVGIVTATLLQIFCFGTVTILGIIVLFSRSGVIVLRTFR